MVDDWNEMFLALYLNWQLPKRQLLLTTCGRDNEREDRLTEISDPHSFVSLWTQSVKSTQNMAQWPVMWPEERADVTNIDEERMKAEIDTLQQRMRDLQKQRNAILGALFTSWHQRNTPPSPEVRYVHVAVPQLVPARIVRGPPPPPPLPPPNFLKQKKPEPMRINKKPEKTNDILNSSVRKIDMSEVIKEIGKVRLRRIERSPGGTPRRQSASATIEVENSAEFRSRLGSLKKMKASKKLRTPNRGCGDA
ncbi:hypothetical protein QR680_011295 [Steinernema hermaphroditum]|uniref:Mitochondrial fission regulator 2 n=1 Tax=Steinernema hermaphroditum TaxID=289476 RepID=A0AA39MD91_9BILA|nr:hypothetical protein QR680_011295 [Steinernema hermaphroditum]